MSDAKQQMDKEYELLRANGDAQLKALEQQHERDREALRRTGAADEAKMQRGLQPKHDAEMRQQQQLLKKEYERMKDSFKKVSGGGIVIVSNLVHTHTRTTVLQPFFRDYPGKPVLEEIFCWTLWCKGR